RYVRLRPVHDGQRHRLRPGGPPLRVRQRQVAEQPPVPVLPGAGAVLGAGGPVPDDGDQAGDRLGPAERDQVGRAGGVYDRLDRRPVPGGEVLRQVHICELKDSPPAAERLPRGRGRGRRSGATQAGGQPGFDPAPFIVLRCSTMSSAELVARAGAEGYAAWVRGLADGTRVKIVSLLARHGRPMKVGEIVAAVQVGQSTVSQHLKVLAAVRFVLAERRGTARYYRINAACVDRFPTAADLVGGLAAPLPDLDLLPLPPFARPIGLAVRPMCSSDADKVLAVYQAGLDAGVASFETEAPCWADFDAARLPGHRHVATATDTGELLGWAAAAPVSSRGAYAGVVE